MKSFSWKRIVCQLACIGCLFWSQLPMAAAAEPQIRVMLAQDAQTVALAAPGGLAVRTAPAAQPLFVAPGVVVSLRNGQFWVGDKQLAAETIYLQPQQPAAATAFRQNRYQGSFVLHKTAKGLLVVNRLPMEEYLDSVVPSEMPSAWPMEALKAQAVAARTFALYRMAHDEHKDYDVCATTHCQVYDGIGVETKSADAAVAATYGQAIIYRHEPILAAFHADSGGRTENSEDVWDTKLPYLRSVADGAKDSPEHHWRTMVAPFDFARRLREAGYDIGTLTAIQLSPLDSQAPDRTAGGGVRFAVIDGSSGSVRLTGAQLRRIFGLRSTRFAIVVLPQSPTAQAQGLTTQKIDKATTQLVIDGYGSGHRLGLSQWGAYDLAQRHKDYLDILYTYYTGVSVYNWYDGGK